eukprot:g183.t1
MSWRGQLSKTVRSLRFVYCSQSAESAGARAFVENNYQNMKYLNPTVTMLVRPAEGVAEPHVEAHFKGLAGTVKVDVKGLGEGQMEEVINALYTQSVDAMEWEAKGASVSLEGKMKESALLKGLLVEDPPVSPDLQARYDRYLQGGARALIDLDQHGGAAQL